jgi:poly [ADP-ribose] polymerase
MSTATSTVKEARYINADVSANANKFWNITIQPDYTVVTHWGRVGDHGQSKSFPHSSLYAAESFFETKCREKEKKGYKTQRILMDSAADVRTVSASSLEQVARQQIKTNSPAMDDLISFLTKANVHNILSATTMEYDTSKGVFTTPLGIVTADAIQDARGLLVQMGDLVFRQDYGNASWNDLLSQYLVTIPQKIGRTRPQPELLFPNIDSIQSQNKILDDLDASLQSVLAGATIKDSSGKEVKDSPQVFNVQISIVDDKRVIDRIKAKYNETRKSMHACNHLEVKRVFLVDIEMMSTAYSTQGKKIGNVMELWHGTRVGNLLSILKGGLKVPPSSSPHVTGRLFGDGVYFSDQSTKSLNYAYGAAPGQRGGIESSTFMFLADVAMGRSFVPSGYGSRHSYPAPGFDSTFAKAGQSGIHNNEMIVYSTHQCNLTYLVEFGAR